MESFRVLSLVPKLPQAGFVSLAVKTVEAKKQVIAAFSVTDCLTE